MGGEVSGSDDDAECIARSLSEPQQFAALYTRHSVTVFRFLARQTDRQSAEDLLAEVFVTAFRIRGRYDGSRANARGWLLGIAVNVARHHYRSRARFMRLSQQAHNHVDSTGREEAGLEQRLASDAARPQLEAALRELPDAQREILLLSVFDLDYDQMADALNIPVGTVRSRLSRARAHMRELLDPDGKYPLTEIEGLRKQSIEQAGDADG
jgi:RNA polymerase sigma factor (sigma-70 family)